MIARFVLDKMLDINIYKTYPPPPRKKIENNFNNDWKVLENF